MKNTYYKVVGITIDALSADIIADGNVKEIDDVGDYIKSHMNKNQTAMWIVTPCTCEIKK